MVANTEEAIGNSGADTIDVAVFDVSEVISISAVEVVEVVEAGSLNAARGGGVSVTHFCLESRTEVPTECWSTGHLLGGLTLGDDVGGAVASPVGTTGPHTPRCPVTGVCTTSDEGHTHDVPSK